MRPCCPGLRLLLLALPLAIAACSGGDDDDDSDDPRRVSGTVRDTAGAPVAGATVYLVPAGRIDLTPITGATVVSGAAAAHDEPLEDLVASPAAADFPQGRTNGEGRYEIEDVGDGEWFFFVQPGAGDAEHLPGGDRSRRSIESGSFLGTEVNLSVSSSPPPDASHVGSSTCLNCHPSHAGAKQTAHFFPLRAPGRRSPLQDTTRYPDIDRSLANFRTATSFSGGTVLYYSDYNGSLGVDKFTVGLTDPSPGGTLYLKVYLWRDASTGEYRVTMQNVINPADPGSPKTLVVRLVQGGAIYKQRYLLAVSGLRGLYPFAQFNYEGNEAYYDRTRKVYTDYRMDSFWDAATNLLRNPPGSRTWEGSCAACHFTGHRTYFNQPTGEWLADAVNDVGGAYDIDADQDLDEIGIGCEDCHGPGSAHVVAREARFIVEPSRLTPERANLICGRCHDRPIGNGTVRDEEPLSAADEFARPGIRRADWLANFTSFNGPGTADLWNDGIHSKKHHQQYSDFLKSPHYRNRSILVTCSDCHHSHGESTLPWGLEADPEDPRSALCQSCHVVDPLPHMQQQTGAQHAGERTLCINCHMPETGKTGAGRYGYLLAMPTGNPMVDPGNVYWTNDISSHVFDMPRKLSTGVRGVLPGNAMPVPYTNLCGTCHDPSQLQWLPP